MRSTFISIVLYSIINLIFSQSIVKFLENDPDQFSTSLNLIETAGLRDVFDNDQYSLTLFVPTNEAFNRLMTTLDVTIQDIQNIPTLKDIMLYHTFQGKILTNSLSDGQQLISLTPDGQTLKISVNGAIIEIIDNQPLTENANIDSHQKDIQVSNGIIHVIDNVLLPLFDDTISIIASFNKFSGLMACFSIYGLIDTLTDKAKSYTILAQPDHVFVDNNYKACFDGAPIEFYKYMILPGTISTDDMVSIGNNNGVLYTMNQTNGDIVFDNEIAINETYIVLKDSYNRKARKVAFDQLYARNGIVHVLDDILLPLN